MVIFTADLSAPVPKTGSENRFGTNTENKSVVVDPTTWMDDTMIPDSVVTKYKQSRLTERMRSVPCSTMGSAVQLWFGTMHGRASMGSI